MLAGNQALEAGGPIGADELRRRRHDGPVVARGEEGEGIALLGDLADAVGGRAEHPVGPDLQHVADIDHEGARDRRGVDPVARAVAHLQPRRGPLQDGEELIVGVGADALLVQGVRIIGIVDQPKLAGRARQVRVEMVLGQVEREREAAEQPPRQHGDRSIVGLDRLAEARQPRP